MEIGEMTRRMNGFTFVRGLSLDVDVQTGQYALQLLLAESEHTTARTMTADFEAVSGLSIADFGGGWAQFLDLAIEDVSAQQHDRVWFHVRELEHEKVSFSCMRIRISEPGAPEPVARNEH